MARNLALAAALLLLIWAWHVSESAGTSRSVPSTSASVERSQPASPPVRFETHPPGAPQRELERNQRVAQARAAVALGVSLRATGFRFADRFEPATERGTTDPVSVAIDGDRIALGSPTTQAREIPMIAGAAFVLDVSPTGEVVRSTRIQPAWGERELYGFGTMVAIDGDTLVVVQDRYPADRIHLFGRAASGWALARSIDAGRGLTSVELEGDLLIAGTDDGHVLEYVRSGGVWLSPARIVAHAAPEATVHVARSGENLAVLRTGGEEGTTLELLERSGSTWRSVSEHRFDVESTCGADPLGFTSEYAVVSLREDRESWIEIMRRTEHGWTPEVRLPRNEDRRSWCDMQLQVAVDGDLVAVAGPQRGFSLYARSPEGWRADSWTGRSIPASGGGVAMSGTLLAVTEGDTYSYVAVNLLARRPLTSAPQSVQ